MPISCKRGSDSTLFDLKSVEFATPRRVRRFLFKKRLHRLRSLARAVWPSPEHHERTAIAPSYLLRRAVLMVESADGTTSHAGATIFVVWPAGVCNWQRLSSDG